MKHIIEGVEQFQSSVYPESKDLFHELAGGQHPRWMFITCADSRIDPNLITQTKPGELFVCRNAGNIVPPHSQNPDAMTCSIEFAVKAIKVSHIVVCGHTDCGAMKGALKPETLTEMPQTANWLEYSRAAAAVTHAKNCHANDAEKLTCVTRENVTLQLRHLRSHPAVAAAMAVGDVELHGWVYDIETGKVEAYAEEEASFKPIEEVYDSDGIRRAAAAIAQAAE